MSTSSQRKRQIVSAALLVGAMAFGMVLAGGLEVTPVLESEPQRIDPPATTVGGLPNFADLAEQVSPAVASIATVRIEEAPSRRGAPMDPFEWFFGPRRMPQEDGQPRERRQDSGGSGFLVDASGLVVTNNHVIEGATSVTVHLGDERFPAEIVGTDPATDIALLRIEGKEPFPYLALGDSDATRPGDWVMAIGSPLTLADTVTVGVISAKGRRIGISAESSFEDFLQTDAAINFGNSGGPLVNLRGEVVGINTAINFGSENIGFAVPVNTLRAVLPQLRETGTVERGFLGIEIADLTHEAAEAFELPYGNGVLVANVTPDTPAERAGLQHGDVILELDGEPVPSTRDFINRVSRKGPGTEVSLGVLRDGKQRGFEIELGTRPSPEELTGRQPSRGGSEGSDAEWLGLRYQDLTVQLKRLHGLPEGLQGAWVSSVAADSPFYDQGLGIQGVQSVITELNGEAVTSAEDFASRVEALPEGSRVRLYVRRFAQGEELSPVFLFPRAP